MPNIAAVLKILYFRLHIMSGLQNDCIGSEVVLRENLAKAIPLLKEADIVGLIEPINSYSIPNYFLNNFELGNAYIFVINS